MGRMEPAGVHELAGMFPLIPGNSPEFKALVADIAANGLREPIVVTPEGLLLDGRNRKRACESAGVEPVYVVEEGDPFALVISRNVQRRHLNAGQRALIVARSPAAGEHSQAKLGALAGVSQQYISMAKRILRESDERTIGRVVKGEISLDAAFGEIVKREEAERQEKRRIDDWGSYLRLEGFYDLAAEVRTRRYSDEEIEHYYRNSVDARRAKEEGPDPEEMIEAKSSDPTDPADEQEVLAAIRAGEPAPRVKVRAAPPARDADLDDAVTGLDLDDDERSLIEAAHRNWAGTPVRALAGIIRKARAVAQPGQQEQPRQEP